MGNRTRSLLAATVVVALTVVGLTAARADAAYSECPAGKICLFDGADGTEDRIDLAPLARCVDLTTTKPAFNDLASSVVNNTGYFITLFQDIGCKGTSYSVAQSLKRGANLPAAYNNWASSYLMPVNYFYAGGFQYFREGTADGIRANVGVNNPYVSAYDFHSLGELAAQSADGRQIVEIGWTKNPNVCKDTTRSCLFGYHWINGVQQGYGVGFLDYAKNPIDLGTAFDSGTQTEMRILYDASSGAGAWWLWLDADLKDDAPGDWLGYFPESRWLDEGVEDFNQVGLGQWFGEVASTSSAPCTDMGSGALPPSTSAAKLEQVQYHVPGTKPSEHADADVGLTVTTPAFYNATTLNSDPTTAFRWGGGGANCKTAADPAQPSGAEPPKGRLPVPPAG